MQHLVVISPFGGREVGETIADMDAIKAILGGEHAHHVVRVMAADSDGPTVETTQGQREPETAALAIRGRKSKTRE